MSDTSRGDVEVARLSRLSAEIRSEVAAAESDYESAVGHALAAGQKLLEAKSLVRHGQWLPWLGENSEHDRGARFCCRSGRDFNLRAKARRQARFVVFDHRRRPLLTWVALALCAAAIAAGCGGGGGTATSGACMSSVAREGQRLVPGLLHGDLRGRQFVNATDAWLAGVKGAGAGILLPARPRPGITFCERRVLGEDREPGRVVKTGASKCVPFRCFRDVVVIGEGLSSEEPEYKYYAPGVGEIL